MYLPMTREEMTKLGWSELDVILITGDAYLDSPFCGAAMLGKVLVQAGLMTLAVSVAAFVVGLALGTLIAWGRVSGGGVARALAHGYTAVMRGVPATRTWASVAASWKA